MGNIIIMVTCVLVYGYTRIIDREVEREWTNNEEIDWNEYYAEN